MLHQRVLKPFGKLEILENFLRQILAVATFDQDTQREPWGMLKCPYIPIVRTISDKFFTGSLDLKR